MGADPSNLPVEPPDTSFLDDLASLDIPSQEQFVRTLTQLNVLQSILLLAVGLLCLLQGWKVFKIIVIVNAAVLGTILGSHLGGLLRGENMPIFGGIGGALLFGVLAWPLMKYAVSIMGGLAGSLLGYGVWHYVANALGKPGLVQYSWAGALIGLITLGLLAFIVFRLVVTVFTAFQGSVLTVSGLLALLLMYQPITEKLERALIDNTHLVPLLIAVPAVIGFAFQETSSRKKRKKKSGGGGGGEAT